MPYKRKKPRLTEEERRERQRAYRKKYYATRNERLKAKNPKAFEIWSMHHG